jgi:hypothetical protein
MELRFDYNNPNPKPPARPHKYGPPVTFETEQDVWRARERHCNELNRRLRWCLEHGHTPAHNHVHLAPGDDSQFMFGVAPWHDDGSVNPPGVPMTVPEAVDRKRLLVDYDSAAGWSCTQCGEWIAARPREATGVEPKTWWWCMKCKKGEKAVEPGTGIERYFKAKATARDADVM